MKRKMAKILTIAIVISLAGANSGNISLAEKVKKPTMPKKETVKIGKTKKVKITSKKKIKKTTWILNRQGKKIVKLSKKKKKNVTVTGVREGITRLTAKIKVGKKTYKLKTKITVKKVPEKKYDGTSGSTPHDGSCPTNEPASTTTSMPTSTPMSTPTSSPTSLPTSTPMSTPASSPTSLPTSTPMSTPASSPTSLPTSTPTPTPKPMQNKDIKLPSIDENNVAAWDCIYFGNYWQEDTNKDGLADENDEKQPIKWRVLQINGNEAFLLADSCLAYRPYYETETEGASWENSDIRKWLNNEFYKNAFSESEQQAIYLKESKNNEDFYHAKSGNNTQDRVALISWTEIANTNYGLYNGRLGLVAAGTSYAMGGHGSSEGCDWITRSITTSPFGEHVQAGDSESSGYGLTGSNGIRPVIYLNLLSEEWSNASSLTSVPYELDVEEQELPIIPEVADVEVSFDADNVVHEGVDGSIKWAIDVNGCLSLEGNGDWEGLGDSFVIVGSENAKYPKWLDYSGDILTAKVNITGITNCSNMFRHCTKLQAVDLSLFDTSSVTNMEDMFYYCCDLQALDVSSFDTSNVTSMASMFYQCELLRKLDLSAFNTVNVENFWGMFYYCKNIQIIDLSSFNTKKVQTMAYMFEGCDNLRKLDLSSFDLEGLSFDKYEERFTFEGYSFSKLTELKSPKNLPQTLFETDKYGDCVNSKELPFWGRNTTPWRDVNGKLYDELPLDLSQSITLTRQISEYQQLSGLSGKLKWNVDLQGKLTISGNGDWNENFWDDYPEWHVAKDYITSCEVNVEGVTDASYFFSDLPYLKKIVFTKFDTSQVTNMQSMFSNCSSLISIDIGGFDTSEVTDMGHMFMNCSSLTNLDISGFDTSQVTDMWSMFEGCHNLKSLKHSNFKMTSVNYICDMFANCGKLEELKLDWNVRGIDNVQLIFSCCHSLKSLDLSGWDLKNVNFGGTSCLEGTTSLKQIKTPKNLPHEVVLPKGIWKDEEGNIYTKLPINHESSILLTKE